MNIICLLTAAGLGKWQEGGVLEGLGPLVSEAGGGDCDDHIEVRILGWHNQKTSSEMKQHLVTIVILVTIIIST
jgi:hypothetical protein